MSGYGADKRMGTKEFFQKRLDCHSFSDFPYAFMHSASFLDFNSKALKP